ncbi:MAG: tRNA guanosine(34) transglycosylase Tgt [Actinomycetota bacterium]
MFTDGAEAPNGPDGPTFADLPRPLFLPDATRAAIRAADPLAVAATGHRAMLCSAPHVMVSPGASVLKAAGGVKALMSWPGRLVSDSGGYQIYSLSKSGNKLASIDDSGMKFRFSAKAKFRTLTPESSIDTQLAIGSDVAYCLDYCTSPTAPRAEQELSVRLTIDWARRCRQRFDAATADRDPDTRPKLFAVVQGGPFPDLRRQCAEALAEVGFDGYGFGGYPIDNGALVDAFAEMPALVPAGVSLHGLGVGTPENVVAGHGAGYDVFDCVLPTRNARRGVLYTRLDLDATGTEITYKTARMGDDSWFRATGPVDPDCDCVMCTSYHAAYLAHLFRIEDSAAATLFTLHNLRFYARLMEALGARAHHVVE